MHTENLTILFVDIAGFTATTNRQSRRQNASLLQNFESLLKPQIKKFSGQLVKSIGDALLLTFRSPTDAMLCACRMQDRLALHHQQHPDEQPIVIRIAAHLGEVRTARHDIFGEAVNLASRIEAVTPPGEIYLSEAVYLAMNKTEVPVKSAGQFQLDGFSHQLTLYRVIADSDAVYRFGSSADELLPRRQPVYWWLTAACLAVFTISGYLWLTRETSLPILTPAPIQLQTGQYISFDLGNLAASQLNSAEQFGLQQSLQQAVKRLNGIYLLPADSPAHAAFLLSARWLDGVFPQADQIAFSLQTVATQTSSHWSIQWLPQQTADNLQQIEQQLLSQLRAVGQFAELYGADNIDQVPDSFYQQYLLALSNLQQGEQTQDTVRLQQSTQELRRLQQALPEFHQAARALCHSLTALYQLSEDSALLQQAAPVCQNLASTPQNVPNLLTYGRYLTLTDDKTKAQQTLLKVLAKDPKSVEAYTLLSQLYLADNQPLEAELVLKRAITVQPNHWPAIQLMALFQLERGQLDEAIHYLQQVILLTPGNATALTNLGSAYLLNGQLQAAADTYQQALQKSPEPFIQANLATVYYYLGRLRDAIKLYQRALEQNQTDYVLHGNIADAYRQNQQTAEAMLHYQQAISLVQDKTVPDARDLALQAHYFSQLDQFEEAVQSMDKAMKKSRDTAEVWLLDALLKTRLGQTQAAVTSATKAMQFGYPAKLLAVDPDLQPLAADPQFLALLNPNIKENP